MLRIERYLKKSSVAKNTFAFVKNDDRKTVGSISLDETVTGMRGQIIEIESNFKFQLAPRPVKEKERSVLFVAGESGAGKSYFTRDYAKEYHAMFPKNPIYLISNLDYDETLDEYDQIQRIDAFTVKFLDDCMKLDLKEYFENSFIIFDDIDSIFNKHIKAKIYGFLAKLLKIGRHYNISVAYVGHELYASPELKVTLNESHTITWFPKFLNAKKSNYLLKEYFGLSKQQITTIQSINNTRSITYIKGGDKVILTEREAFIL
jgi:tRNA A37 threonylcarbamoyladenosine biosynthesis protein TsaE